MLFQQKKKFNKKKNVSSKRISLAAEKNEVKKPFNR